MLTFAEARALRAEAGRVTGNVIAPLGFGAKIDLLSYLVALSFSVQGAYPGTAEYDSHLAEYLALFTAKITAMGKAEHAKNTLPPLEALAAVVEALGIDEDSAREWLEGCGVVFPEVRH